MRLRFGVGLFRRTLPIADLVRCDRMRTRLRWGWGLHWTPAGWLYNVSGRDAVRLELRRERPVIIGSDDADALKTAIDARIAAHAGRPSAGNDGVQRRCRTAFSARSCAARFRAKKVYEDDDVLAFHDIQPLAPVHFMLIPKRHIASLADAARGRRRGAGQDAGAAPGASRASRASPDGFRTIVNTGRIGRQDVKHVHVHVIGGPEPLGPDAARGTDQHYA